MSLCYLSKILFLWNLITRQNVFIRLYTSVIQNIFLFGEFSVGEGRNAPSVLLFICYIKVLFFGFLPQHCSVYHLQLYL